MYKVLMKKIAIVLWGCLLIMSCAQKQEVAQSEVKIETEIIEKPILVGATQTDQYFPLLKGKKIALVVNQTSLIGTTHLVDSLEAAGMEIVKIFAPEHGFRGKSDAGEQVKNGMDAKTGLPIVSLYGKQKKPSPAHLSGVEYVIFDIQDVGVRYYTYITTMHYMMEACAEQQVPFMVLDRPNPNGDYIDGPVLETNYASFVGKHQIPLVHGCTVGELAQMINEEGWLLNEVKVDLRVIKCENYTHQSRYSLPVKPSPNLPNDLSIRLYPSFGLFEGTIVSVGRGTDSQFQVLGHPFYTDKAFSFTPVSKEGAKYPPYKNKECYGKSYEEMSSDSVKLSLKPLIHFYQEYKQAAKGKNPFFNSFFYNLSGTRQLKEQIMAGMSEEEIRTGWQEKLSEYESIRKKYLLYK